MPPAIAIEGGRENERPWKNEKGPPKAETRAREDNDIEYVNEKRKEMTKNKEAFAAVNQSTGKRYFYGGMDPSRQRMKISVRL